MTNFTIQELTHSDIALRKRIDNTPNAEVFANLNRLILWLEIVRGMLGAPMIINSGYRCKELNKLIGGAKDSAHMQGWAADFICPQFGTPLQIVKKIASSELIFDQCIQEGTWVHISFAPTSRREVLTAHFNGRSTTYTKGA